jgi:histidinol dehydrogenase
MEIVKYPQRESWKDLLKLPRIDHSELENVVSEILVDVKNNGDKALKDYSLKFDKVELKDFKVSQAEIDEANLRIDEPLKKAIGIARGNLEKFHDSQKVTGRIIETTPGVRCWLKSIPIEKVGLYIPGGTAPLFSTVLMLEYRLK